MKQLFATLLFLTAAAFAGVAQSDSDVYKYAVEEDLFDEHVECWSGMMGDLSNDFSPSVYNGSDGVTHVCFNLLSIQDYKPDPTRVARIKITFDNGKFIGFSSTCHAVSEDSPRMRIQMSNVTAEQLRLLATHDIVSWTMNGRIVSIKSPTAGMFTAMFKGIGVKDSDGRSPALGDASPVIPPAGRHHLCMAVRPKNAPNDAHIMLLNADQWRRLKNKEEYERQAILINYDNDKCFLVDYYDQYDRCGYPDWFTAVEMYGDRIPTALMGAILSQTTELRDVANAFGGDNYGNYYWTSTICDDSDGSEAYVFCPAIPDAPIDRQKMTEPTNAGVLLVDIPFEEVYDLYLSDTLW